MASEMKWLKARRRATADKTSAAGWRGLRVKKGRPVVGAAIGIGIAAAAAARGGADFLLVLNAGRLRVMGAPSPSCMLPIGDSNRCVIEIGMREILGRVSAPVFVGACVFDPRQDIPALLKTIRQAGFAGIANFPTAIHLHGSYRDALEKRGVGFAREAEMLRLARKTGLLTFGYAVSRSEALALARVKPTLFCLNFGWNAGGTQGLAERFDLDEAAERARSVIQAFRRLSPHSICLIEGGPIVTADDMYQVYVDAHADGYVGGSTIDRLPFEESVAQSTSAFKTVSYFRHELSARNRRIAAFAGSASLAGQSRSFLAVIERASYLAATDTHIMIRGERGSGKTTLARAIHAWSKKSGGIYILDAATDLANFHTRLFGTGAEGTARRKIGALEMDQCTVIIENIDALDTATLAVLQSALASGVISSESGEKRRLSARVVATSYPESANEKIARVLDRIFSESTIRLPPLRERPDDLVPIARRILATILSRARDAPVQISASGYRFLFAHDWPGNVAELRLALEQAAATAKSAVLGYSDFAGGKRPAAGSRKPLAEHEEQAWILASLKRNRFRKSETAQDLGISRRTLYNKMQKFGLTG